jgi:hypothetical protein
MKHVWRIQDGALIDFDFGVRREFAMWAAFDVTRWPAESFQGRRAYCTTWKRAS